MDLVVANGAIPILMSHWTYQASHPWLKDDFICARFADDEENAGQRWFGNNLEEYQQALNQGFRLAAKQEPTARISWVGDRWQRVINDPYQLITSGMLYQNDHKHPDMYGTFFNALILAHDILDIDVEPATYRPPHVTLDEFEYLKFNASF